MKDTKDHRTGFVAVSEDNKETTHNRQVDILIVGTLPILAGAFIDRVTADSATPFNGTNEVYTLNNTIPSETLNVLVDLTKDDNGVYIKLDRYKFLGRAASTQYTGMFVDFYFDKNFNDIIVVPDLKTFGIGDNVTFYNNDRRTISGYAIGNGQSINDKPLTTTHMPLILDDKEGIKEPNRFIKTRTLTVMAYGLESNSMATSISREQNGVANYSEKGSPLQLVEFDLNEVLFGDSTTKVHTYNLLQQRPAELKIDYVGKQKINKIVVPVNF